MTNDKNDDTIPEAYKGREQSYVKHIFLKNYIEKVAYNILSARHDFAYIDGFSGPWQSTDEGYDDTSFAIAISKLTSVKRTYRKRDKPRTVRCLFIEKDAECFKKLDAATQNVPEVQTTALHGSFEDNIEKIISFIGTSFFFIFIDPKGWKGYSLTKISPLLQKRGEVIINFMFGHINRFIEDPRPELTKSFNPVFGDDQWFKDFSTLINQGETRENAILSVYLDRLKKVGGFKYVTSTCIKHPEKKRTYFHLIYGSHHPKGIVEFRQVEKKAAGIQEKIRVGLKIHKKTSETGIADLFGPTQSDTRTLDLEQERAKNLKLAKRKFVDLLNANPTHRFDHLQATVLETPLVWVKDLNTWISELKKSAVIKIPAMKPKERTAKPNYLINVQKMVTIDFS